MAKKNIEKPNEVRPVLIALSAINALVVFFVYQRFEQSVSIIRQLISGEEISMMSRLSLYSPSLILLATGFYLSVSIIQFGNSLQKNILSVLLLVMVITSFFIGFVILLPSIDLNPTPNGIGLMAAQ